MKKLFNLSVFTENKIGLLNRISIIFTRRHINIESITASESEVKGVYRYTIIVQESEEQVIKVIKQIEKQVDVFKAFYHSEEEVVYQELALFKLSSNSIKKGIKVEKIIRDNYARILSIEADFIIIEKTGHQDEILNLFRLLEPFEILEFARSGRVAISKPIKPLSEYLKEIEYQQK
jgi:acetolactate synthase-1/3 small subunit